MEYNVTFMVDKDSIAENNIAPIFESYEWWRDLVMEALNNTDEFEMRLWEGDLEGIQSGQKFGKQVTNHDTMEIVYRGKVVPEFRQEVLNNYLAKEGYIKWFTLNLYKDNRNIFSSCHYGDETYILAISEKQVNTIKEWAEGQRMIWRLDVFECQ